MVVETWKAWAKRVGCGASGSAAEGRRVLERAAADLGAPAKARPWPSR